ncbi:MAG: ATPase RavA [Enterobacteriaceae bacterium]|jgi:MoxR-like ATPase|nr:ATPase RavA [Enterobacteriaceae bacterium]
MQLVDKISQLSQYLERGLYERRQAVRLCLLAALCGESVFLLGPPGIAKSLIARRLKFAFQQAHAFEYLMTRFSTPEEIFGPLSIQALKDEGRYLRLTKGYLPEAEVVFLDEIWKAGPAILNTLLTAINEKKFRNGSHEEQLPMRLLITASNELPETGNSLEALYDRILIRIWLDNIQEKKNFRALMTEHADECANPVPDHCRITDAEFDQWQDKIRHVSLPIPVFELIYQLREQINATENIPRISDRRWKKSLHLLQASAFFNGRENISPLDLVLLQNCLWHDLNVLKRLPQLLHNLLMEQAYQQRSLAQEIEALYQQWMKSRQDENQHHPLQLVTKSSFFGRHTHYFLPKNIHDEKLVLFLYPSLNLHDLTVNFIEIDKTDLENSLKNYSIKNYSIKNHLVKNHLNKNSCDVLSIRLNGIGFPQKIPFEINEENQIEILDISHNNAVLCQAEQQQEIPAKEKTHWHEKMLSLRDEIQHQHQLFHQHQPCVFIEAFWIANIEQSFFQLTEKLKQLGGKIGE